MQPPDTALVFPGQGSQTPGMGKPWTDRPGWELVARAEKATGFPVAHLLLEADDDELSTTANSQISVMVASLLAAHEWVSTDLADRVVAIAGHSLGQITALVVAGAVSVDDGLTLAAARARGAEQTQRSRPGAMVALLGSDQGLAEQVCSSMPSRAWVAAINGPRQIVVGVEETHLDELHARCDELGCRRTRRLSVDGAFHTPLQRPTADALAPLLESIRFRTPRWPIVTNHDAVPVSSGDGWPERLRRHLTSPVRWAETVQRLDSIGGRRFVEIGPGSTLTGTIDRILTQGAVA